jgi:hypothetical protein
MRATLVAVIAMLMALSAAADSQPPVISRPTAKPSVLSPANDELVNVSFAIEVRDDTDPSPRCAVRNVFSDQDISERDWKVTGDFEVALRATSTADQDRRYNVVVVCTDASGNEAGDFATVVVPAKQTKTDAPPLLRRITATPDTLAPSNNMERVRLDVDVVDDNDPKPRCAIHNVFSDQAITSQDYQILSDFDIALRARPDGNGDLRYNVVVVCTDSAGNEAGHHATVVVVAKPPRTDNPPVVHKVTASPDVLENNGELQGVRLGVEVTDDSDPKPRCTIRNVFSDQAITENDWRISGELEVALRGAAGEGQDRIYNVAVVCTDSAGNEAGHHASVRVPAKQTPTDAPPVIVKLTATPDVLQPNGELQTVKVEVDVIDDIDPRPRCSITNVFSDQFIDDDDWKILDDFAVALRGKTIGGQERIYSVVVTCLDSSGNAGGDSVQVRVPLNGSQPSTAVPVTPTTPTTPATPTKRRSAGRG